MTPATTTKQDETPAPDQNRITLKTPIEFEGETIREVNLDLENLTGEDLCNAEREFLITSGGMNLTGVAMTCQEYHMHVAARAAGLSVEAIKQMKARDCARLITETQGFLLGAA